jgi:hypothetical protein
MENLLLESADAFLYYTAVGGPQIYTDGDDIAGQGNSFAGVMVSR